jgi:hypothetical protein
MTERRTKSETGAGYKSEAFKNFESNLDRIFFSAELRL